MRQRHTEEVVDVRAEVVDVAASRDERAGLPVGVGAGPEVPGVASDSDARVDLGADGIDAGVRSFQ